MKGRPALEEFLSGGSADTEAKKAVVPFVPAPTPKIIREQKVFRLPVTLTESLRRVVFHYSALQNRRVTETEIVELAIQSFIDSTAI